MRILAVGNMYPPHHAGGYELAWQAAMRHARALGHEVRVLTSDYRQATARPEEDPDVHRSLRWYWDLERYEFPRLRPRQRLGLERHNARELDRHLREFAPDHVSWWSMGCMSLSLIERVRRAGLPASFVVHDDWLVYGVRHDQWIRMWRGPRRRLAPLTEALSGVPTTVDLDRSGSFVFNSHHTFERALRSGLRPARTTVVTPGIDERFLLGEPALPAPWSWRLLYVGRVDRQKGIDTAVRALAALPRAATLDVWGSGDESYALEMRGVAAELGLADRVRFHGFASAEALPGIYAAADAVIFPVRWEEPFGLVPLEAMGVGRPVVSTARGGTTEYLRDGMNALVFDAGDEVALADRLLRLAGDERLRARLCREGRATAEQHTVVRFAQRTVAAMLSAQASPRPAGAYLAA